MNTSLVRSAIHVARLFLTWVTIVQGNILSAHGQPLSAYLVCATYTSFQVDPPRR